MLSYENMPCSMLVAIDTSTKGVYTIVYILRLYNMFKVYYTVKILFELRLIRIIECRIHYINRKLDQAILLYMYM